VGSVSHAQNLTLERTATLTSVDIAIGGAKQDRLTLTTFEACIDECNARQNSGQGCDRVAYIGSNVVNQCLLSTGAPKEVANANAKSAVRK
jgi:hypothetical protein